MLRIVFVTWNGGGNLVPALGIARELQARGHQAAFLGQETQRQAIETAGHPFTGYTADTPLAGPASTAAERQLRLMRDIWLNARFGDDLATLLARNPADAVVVDCMLAGILARSGEFAAPAAVLVHGLYQSVLPMRDAMLAAGSQMLAGAGLAVPDLGAMKWESKDLVLVATLPELDGVAGSTAGDVRYLGRCSPGRPHRKAGSRHGPAATRGR